MRCPALLKAKLIKRYKRFLADVILPDGQELTVHCPNTGAMTGCAEPGYEVWLSISDNAKRKYPHTWELARNSLGHWMCIHSAKANKLVHEGIVRGVIKELQGYESIRTEVKYGNENSRIDLMLEDETHKSCFVEVKSVTLRLEGGDGLGLFPDAVSDRGRKHLRELIAMRQQGHRAVLLFCVQHTGINRVAPADTIDSRYGETFREAIAAGVEVLAYGVELNEHRIEICHALPVIGQQPF
ncbi:MAG: sugar fermentation stimulation protein A [Pseudohongiellaceae bacterium]|jgi:sugar fermentation stimulation protein A